ncbi:DNA adenine methylase [Caldicellulosiruptor bescii]|uniref:site-specific DNA-methyltransferase (adenine-specific) n=2 Tax=Caldicellulosiruptor bescii TaxID=31899 RepID=B9MLA5_CALBD|nr:DNA adenine methylase [Caldicellulosiruptor bescii]ACM61095.1 D12 class N6 adenine-specific DNA methyltransferase [Caldicellulosiruptor bescii DSM 6725]
MKGAIFMRKTCSPLRYPGGKTFLSDFMKKVLMQNNLTNCIYAEPYAGGGGLALSLLYERMVKKILLNDIDPAIFSLWYSMLYFTEQLCGKIRKCKVDINTYIDVKKKFKTTHNVLELGFATLFLNRVNRSGILKAGPIGGYKQEGKYKIDCRFNKEKIIQSILKIAEQREKIEIFNLDALHFLKEIKQNFSPEEIFIFLDPPYYQKGNELYMNFYKHEDHQFLCEFLITELRDYKWILTYDNSPQIMEMYKNKVPFELINVRYSANKNREAIELLFYNNIVLPTNNKRSA